MKIFGLPGLNSVYTHWRGIDVMFHVSTLLPYEKNDPQEPVSIKINYGLGLVLVYPIIPVKCSTPSPYNSGLAFCFMRVQIYCKQFRYPLDNIRT